MMHHPRFAKSASALFLVLGTLLFATQAVATLWVRVDDETLVRQVVARGGWVVEVEAADLIPTVSARMPSTHQRMRVARVIFGEPGTAEELTVRWRGGETADGLHLKVEGVRPLPASTRAVLFVKPGVDGTYDVLHLFQGVFEIAHHEGRDFAFRSLGGTEVEPSPAGDKQLRETERARDLDAFVSWIEEVAAGRAPAATYWRDVPIDALRASADDAPGAIEKFNFFGNPFRWTHFDANLTVSLRAHQDGQQGLAGGGFAEFVSAMNAWNNDAGSKVRYAYAGTTTAAGGFDRSDGVSAILFNDLGGAGDFDEPFSCSEGGVIATGGGWVISNHHTHQGLLFGRMVEADIITNANTACILGTPATAREVFGHELGHTLGLGHSCGGGAGSCAGKPLLNEALMRATVHADGRGAQLNADDRAGINFLYPEAVQQPPTAPTGLFAFNAGNGGVNLGWSDNSTNETGFAIERRDASSNFAQIATVGTNNNSYQDGSAPSGSTVTYRVRAFNGAGSSGYSNQATVDTTGPSPPADLAVTSLSPHALRLDWTDTTDDETAFEVQIRRTPGNFVFATMAMTEPNQTQQIFDELFTGSGFEFRVRALTPTGNSSWSQAASGATLPYEVGEPCVNGPATVCLNGGRFQNRVLWREFAGKAGLGQRIASDQSTDSGLFWFFGEENWEMLVKVLDACGVNQTYWVFSAATTNVEYTLQVLDTLTGTAVTYLNPLGTAAPAITDTAAFTNACGVGAALVAPVAAPDLAESSPLDKALACDVSHTGSDTKLLLNGRFEVEIDWRDFENRQGPGKLVPFCSDNSGLFWFFGPDNWELLVKVLDGCDLNERYWVFAAATTSVEYVLTVTDTQSDQTRTYVNPLGQASDAVTDTDAFATCP